MIVSFGEKYKAPREGTSSQHNQVIGELCESAGVAIASYQAVGKPAHIA